MIENYPTIEQLHATSDRILWKTNEQFQEQNIILQNAGSAYTDAKILYESKYAIEIEILKNSGQPISIIKELAKKSCFEEYANMVQLERKKKNARIGVEYLLERINSIKQIIKIKTST